MLTQASHVVLFDRPWNPAKENQAIDRAHRLGQQRTVTVRPLITENTLEDRVDELLKQRTSCALRQRSQESGFSKTVRSRAPPPALRAGLTATLDSPDQPECRRAIGRPRKP
ncbi:helicase-related protein [Streptomyces sp. NPDC006692]|uniref:helicase-related protein n=1 Tax=Streptomyces sp. NPDC006692 TaxID=3364758 RepID=UPI0036CD1DFA